MAFRKTTILPTDDRDLARRMFKDLVHEEPHVLLVVLHTGKDAEVFAQRADKMSGKEGEPRWVVWARNPDDIAVNIAALTGANKLGALPRVRGFSLSLSDDVRDVITMDEPLPSLLRIFLAYARAEKAGIEP